MSEVVFLGAQGPILNIEAPDQLVNDVVVRDSVIFGDRAINLFTNAFGTSGSVADVDGLVLTNNAWFPLALFGSGAFVEVNYFEQTSIRRSVLRGNVLSGGFETSSWLKSVNSVFLFEGRDLHNVEVSGASGVGIETTEATARQLTLVGLDAAFDGNVDASESILWDTDEIFLGAGSGSWPGTVQHSIVPGGCPPGMMNCEDREPQFLRYHPFLWGELWDLRLSREEVLPGVLAADWPCNDEGSLASGTEAIDSQWGAYGNAAGLGSAQGPDPREYDDCDNDGIYDSWQTAFLAFNAGFDLDGDGLSNAVEFLIGTLPTVADTDGDEVDDNVELTSIPISHPLNPCDPAACPSP